MPSLLWMLLEGVPRTVVRVVRSAGYWVGSVVGGGVGAFCGDMGYHSAFFGVFFLGVWSFRASDDFFCHLLYILSNFYHVGRGGCCVVVIGGWLLRRLRACTKAPPCTLQVVSGCRS
jgi:hypothetical protein